MKNKLEFLWKLFCATFLLSALTFGGGYVIVSLMKDRFVNDYHWIDDEEMLNLISIAQSSPGPIAVNAAIIIGYQLAGVLGILTTVIATVLPPFVIISVISLFYQSFSQNQWVALILEGMQAGVAAVIISVVIEMCNGIIKKKNYLLNGIMIVTFIAVYYMNIDVSIIILFCLCIGILINFFDKEKSHDI
ncbi:chromate transporter [Facklamia sp. DSM 111018]|uniref:Chromate transporter n=1 Tax=Facklamia lactis TaxID=2749967 RepID=A0ABS0LRI6_9LACT|nr:chromate transporter [Facklamia lactis]MBG9980855.1 chromate transporter [Facklamia lactis]MBG9986782.1 chromate transporter [Facklamia lactis]